MPDIKSWMDQVCLKLNDAKTEFIYFGWPSQLGKCTTTTININGETITRSSITKYLGAHLDSAFNLQRICATRKYLTRSASNKLIVSLVISHLDYTNALQGGLPKCSIDQLQRV